MSDYYDYLLGRHLMNQQDAEGYSLKSEGYAKGTQNGSPVTSGSPYYENNAKYFYEQAESVYESIPLDYTTLSNVALDIKYVSESGNDNNSGTSASPLATVDKALELGAGTILISGGTYIRQIDLSKAKKKNIVIRNISQGQHVTFTDENRKVISSETLVSGYTKVYSATFTPTLNANNIWLFQDNVHDPKTDITNAERHPLQKGFEKRCLNTRITKCSSGTLADALTEIENSTEYLWYLDGTTLYFSRPYTVSATNPICYSAGKKLFLNASKDISVTLVGIRSLYYAVNFDDTTNSTAIDCISGYNFGDGSFTWNNCKGAKFVRCEATQTFNGTAGDGFNAHSLTSGSSLGKTTTATLIDCWSHDNRDDGFSDHERCESTIIGGLFEYNRKAGVTPSYGSHCSVYNAISRKNYSGFRYTGEVTQAEGGKYGQVNLFGCLAIDNTLGASDTAGYMVDGSGNKMSMYNCKSIGNKIGFYGTSGTIMDIVDCGSLNDTVVKTGGGTKNISNTTPVSN